MVIEGGRKVTVMFKKIKDQLNHKRDVKLRQGHGILISHGHENGNARWHGYDNVYFHDYGKVKSNVDVMTSSREV